MSFLTEVFSSPLFGLGMGGVSTGISSAARYNEVQAENMAAEWNAALMRQQSDLAGLRAQNALDRGEVEADEVMRHYDTVRGQQRVDYSAAGVDVNSGSAALTQADTAAEGVYAAGKTRYNAALESWEARQQQRQLDFQAQMTLANKRNPWVPAATEALTGLTSMYSRYNSLTTK